MPLNIIRLVKMLRKYSRNAFAHVNKIYFIAFFKKCSDTLILNSYSFECILILMC